MAAESPEVSPQPSPYGTGYRRTQEDLTVTRNFKQQAGVSLLISLVILLLLTIIMLTAIKVTVLEERMAGNLKNHNIAFQAAESALREAESLIDSGAFDFNPLKLSNGPFQNTTPPICVGGLCGTSTPLQSDNFASAAGKKTASTGIATIVTEPEYIIELIRIDPSTHTTRVYATFRITARAWGGDINSLVQLQSTYRLHTLSFVH